MSLRALRVDLRDVDLHDVDLQDVDLQDVKERRNCLSVQPGKRCAVCGHGLGPRTPAYLLVSPPRSHGITILRWNRILAANESARGACSSEHAIEVVAHWMFSGRLDLTFTRQDTQTGSPQASTQFSAQSPVSRHKPIGEIVIDQESVRNMVASDPDALASVLDSLRDLLRRDRPGKQPTGPFYASQQASIA